MAIYVSPTRRRRRLLAVGILGLLIGIGAGWVVMTVRSTSVAERVERVRREGGELAIRVDRLTIEYEQLLNESGADVGDAGIGDELRSVRRDANRLVARSPWLPRRSQLDIGDGIDALEQVVSRRDTTDAFEKAVDAATATIRAVFGTDELSNR